MTEEQYFAYRTESLKIENNGLRSHGAEAEAQILIGQQAAAEHNTVIIGLRKELVECQGEYASLRFVFEEQGKTLEECQRERDALQNKVDSEQEHNAYLTLELYAANARVAKLENIHHAAHAMFLCLSNFGHLVEYMHKGAGESCQRAMEQYQREVATPANKETE